MLGISIGVFGRAQAGWEVWFYADAVVTHYHQAQSDRRMLSRASWIHLKSMWRYYRKHLAPTWLKLSVDEERLPAASIAEAPFLPGGQELSDRPRQTGGAIGGPHAYDRHQGQIVALPDDVERQQPQDRCPGPGAHDDQGVAPV
jgi:hypothetical protein